MIAGIALVGAAVVLQGVSMRCKSTYAQDTFSGSALISVFLGLACVGGGV